MNMTRYLLAALFTCASVALGQRVPDAALRSGTLSFTGHSTLGTFVGTTSAVRGGVKGSDDLASARGWVEAPVATLATGNDHRDRDLRASMEVDKYSTMRFDLTGVSVESAGATADTIHATLHGRLTIHGVTRDASIPATLVVSGDVIDVVGVFPLDLDDYRIGGLTRFLGALRMQSKIEISVRLRFETTPYPPLERSNDEGNAASDGYGDRRHRGSAVPAAGQHT